MAEKTVVTNRRAFEIKSPQANKSPPAFVHIDQADAGNTNVRVRMTVDLVGSLAAKLEDTSAQLGKTKTELVREGLAYVFHALKAQREGFVVGAWKEDEDGRISRSREFTIGH